jgi:hypothetical protein
MPLDWDIVGLDSYFIAFGFRNFQHKEDEGLGRFDPNYIS